MNFVEGYDDLIFGVFVVICMIEEMLLIVVLLKECGVFVWKVILNIINFIEGVGFLVFLFVIVKGGIVGIVVFIIMFFIYWFIVKILIECFYKKDNFYRCMCVCFFWNEIGKEMWLRFGGIMIVVI